MEDLKIGLLGFIGSRAFCRSLNILGLFFLGGGVCIEAVVANKEPCGTNMTAVRGPGNKDPAAMPNRY